MTFTPALAQLLSTGTSPRFACFSDFDGTITDEDSNDFMIDNLGMGLASRRELLLKVLHEGLPFREAFREMIASVAKTQSFPDCCRLVKEANVKLDPGFKAFYEFLKANQIPLVIVSSGMIPIIRAIVSNLFGDEEAAKLIIIANEVDFMGGNGAPGTWGVKFRHPESPFGHDKDVAISEFKAAHPGTTTFFCGDGLSDLSAARSATLFVKLREGSGNDLAVHCEKESVPFQAFENFFEVRDDVKAVLSGEVEVADLCTGRSQRINREK